jgi:hypothetical protein
MVKRGMTEKGPDESGVFQQPVTPGHRPGVHVERLKVTGGISPLPATLPPSRPDELGFRIKSGMTEKDRTADRGRLWSSAE